MLIKTTAIASLSLYTLLLTACALPPPMQFGMEQSQFQQLTKDQQDQVIAGYNQRQQTDANNAVINNAINSATSIIALKETPVNTAIVTPDNHMPTIPAMPDISTIHAMPTIPIGAGYSHTTETSHTTTNNVQASL